MHQQNNKSLPPNHSTYTAFGNFVSPMLITHKYADNIQAKLM